MLMISLSPGVWEEKYSTTLVVVTCKNAKLASVTVNIYQVELALVVVVSCFSRPSVLRYEHFLYNTPMIVTTSRIYVNTAIILIPFLSV